MRFLLSAPAAEDVGPRIAAVFGQRPFQILTPPVGLAQDFDAALVTRDITGKSTKLQLEPHTQAFHDALRQARSLRWVHIHSAGADRPIYAELRARGVTVTTSSGANAAIVAQTALAGILALSRRFPLLMEQQRARQWKSLFTVMPRDLAGQSAVIVGWGPIAQSLAKWLHEFGVRVTVVRNSAQPAAAFPTLIYDRLKEAAAGADWLVIACPLSDRTRRMVDREILAAMPAGAHIANVGRGEIVVETALIAALESGHIAGAYLDVFEREPLPPESPLWSLPNVIVTPHSAGISAGNAGRVIELFLANLRKMVPDT